MVVGLDSSSDRPTPPIIAQAYAAGVRVWGGYLVSDDDATVLEARARGQGLRGLLAPWTLAEFRVVTEGGMRAIGFCSGNDSPGPVGDKARANGILPCLDDEQGIRPVGGWEQTWLHSSGAGLYGAQAQHDGITAPFHIAAFYPSGGCPGASWPDANRPAAPCGWQCQGSHQEFGLTVDRGIYDDWFGAGVKPEGVHVALIPYPDTTPRLDDAYVGADGQVYWGAFPGGAGDLVSYQGQLTPLGPQGGGVVAATGAYKAYTDPATGTVQQRLHVRAVFADGSRKLKVMDGASFAVILDWTTLQYGPAELVPASSADTTLRTYLRGGPA